MLPSGSGWHQLFSSSQKPPERANISSRPWTDRSSHQRQTGTDFLFPECLVQCGSVPTTLFVCLDSELWSSLCWKNKTCTCPGRGSRSAAKPIRLWSACVWGAFMNWGIMELNSVVAAQWTVGRWKVDFGSNWGRFRTQRENWGPDAVSVLTGLSLTVCGAHL